jgi:hypothetical protein
MASPPEPPPAELPRPIAGVAEFADSGVGACFCARATTTAEWRTLRERLQLPAPGLGDDFADFAVECVVAVAPGRARVWPGFAFAVGDEEDVDVLTVTQTAPSGEDCGERSPLVCLRWPRRGRALAVVLRRACGPAPAGEQTLAVFER